MLGVGAKLQELGCSATCRAYPHQDSLNWKLLIIFSRLPRCNTEGILEALDRVVQQLLQMSSALEDELLAAFNDSDVRACVLLLLP